VPSSVAKQTLGFDFVALDVSEPAAFILLAGVQHCSAVGDSVANPVAVGACVDVDFAGCLMLCGGRVCVLPLLIAEWLPLLMMLGDLLYVGFLGGESLIGDNIGGHVYLYKG
jgi:hypothetical protein